MNARSSYPEGFFSLLGALPDALKQSADADTAAKKALLTRFFSDPLTDDFLIVTHAHPDGDALGSAKALRDALRNIGKRAEAVCDDDPGHRLAFVFGEGVCTRPSALPDDFRPRFIVTVDLASLHLAGDGAEELRGKIAVKLDHHLTGEDFAEFSVVEPEAASCGEVVFDIVDQLGAFSDSVASALYTAIASDTGGFAYSNVSSRTHLAAARLHGFDIGHTDVCRRLFENRTQGEVAATRECLNAIRYLYGGRLAYIAIDNRFKEEHGVTDEDFGEINRIPRSIEGVWLGITLREKSEKPGQFRVSMRSTEEVDVSVICGRLGGGGHARAAGAVVSADSTEAAVKIVLDAAGPTMDEAVAADGIQE